jgi:hypothetical protein
MSLNEPTYPTDPDRTTQTGETSQVGTTYRYTDEDGDVWTVDVAQLDGATYTDDEGRTWEISL